MARENIKNIEGMIDAQQLADLTGFSISYIRKAVREMELPYYDFGRWKFRPSEVENWLQKRKKIRKSG